MTAANDAEQPTRRAARPGRPAAAGASCRRRLRHAAAVRRQGEALPAPGSRPDEETQPTVDACTSVHPDLVVGRRSRSRCPPVTRISFATYFNAFPASYWRRWTSSSTVTLAR